MGFLDILNQYLGQPTGQARLDAEQHFDDVAQSAPREVVSDGLAQAFRSDQTPPFAEMVRQLFGNSDPDQRAGLLNQLMGALGPGMLGQLAGSPLGDLFRRVGTGAQVSPEQAATIDARHVEDVARQAEQHNPGVIDRVSEFYAEHPGLVKTLGSAALTIALAKMAQRSRT